MAPPPFNRRRIFPAIPTAPFSDADFDPNDILCLGSSDDESPYAQSERIQDKAERYLRGEPLYIHSALLRGPVVNNPWKKRSKSVKTHVVDETQQDQIQTNFSSMLSSPPPAVPDGRLSSYFTAKKAANTKVPSKTNLKDLAELTKKNDTTLSLRTIYARPGMLPGSSPLSRSERSSSLSQNIPQGTSTRIMRKEFIDSGPRPDRVEVEVRFHSDRPRDIYDQDPDIPLSIPPSRLKDPFGQDPDFAIVQVPATVQGKYPAPPRSFTDQQQSPSKTRKRPRPSSPDGHHLIPPSDANGGSNNAQPEVDWSKKRPKIDFDLVSPVVTIAERGRRKALKRLEGVGKVKGKPKTNEPNPAKQQEKEESNDAKQLEAPTITTETSSTSDEFTPVGGSVEPGSSTGPETPPPLLDSTGLGDKLKEADISTVPDVVQAPGRPAQIQLIIPDHIERGPSLDREREEIRSSVVMNFLEEMRNSQQPSNSTTELDQSSEKLLCPPPPLLPPAEPETPWQGTQAHLLNAKQQFFNAMADSPITFDTPHTNPPHSVLISAINTTASTNRVPISFMTINNTSPATENDPADDTWGGFLRTPIPGGDPTTPALPPQLPPLSFSAIEQSGTQTQPDDYTVPFGAFGTPFPNARVSSRPSSPRLPPPSKSTAKRSVMFHDPAPSAIKGGGIFDFDSTISDGDAFDTSSFISPNKSLMNLGQQGYLDDTAQINDEANQLMQEVSGFTKQWDIDDELRKMAPSLQSTPANSALRKKTTTRRTLWNK
ncbi:hypothetical protein EDC01DRAFT_725632 [Geopyxis carbonaria]|nr:hypothetical protein EDC01DRAFT_725632 [Geopyxis carbonaria]